PGLFGRRLLGGRGLGGGGRVVGGAGERLVGGLGVGHRLVGGRLALGGRGVVGGVLGGGGVGHRLLGVRLFGQGGQHGVLGVLHGLGRGGGFVRHGAVQQRHPLGQGLHRPVGGRHREALAVEPAVDGQEGLARVHVQRGALGGGQGQRGGGVPLGPADLLPAAVGDVQPGAAGQVVLAGVAVVLDAAGGIQDQQVLEADPLAVVGVGG